MARVKGIIFSLVKGFDGGGEEPWQWQALWPEKIPQDPLHVDPMATSSESGSSARCDDGSPRRYEDATQPPASGGSCETHAA